ncbi:MAG: sterol desaturase family protein, partial [Stellaceae bacterium]
VHSGSMAVRIVSWLAIFVLAVMFTEFWMYWFHRLQHANRFLWGFHRVHHTVRELNAVNALDHFSDPFFALPWMFLPSMLVFSFDNGPWPYLLVQLVWAHGIFDHAATRLTLGRHLRFFIVDNRFHRIHHSLDPIHFDKNFSTRFTVWDYLFGTAYFPKHDEILDVGIADATAPTFKDYLAIPERPKLQSEAAA